MRKSKVILIEDDPTVSSMIVDYLSQQKYDVLAFSDPLLALNHVINHGLPHIALIDLMLPVMHGFEVASRLKGMGDVPIIFVTSVDDTDTIVNGLSRYAEDFIVKPFELRELEARVRVVLRRLPSFDYANEPLLVIDEHLQIDFPRNRIVLNGKPSGMTPTESLLLHVLVRNAGRVVENSALIARVWPSQEVYDDTLRVHMHRLRSKLEVDSHHPYYIRTERSMGYVFTVRPSHWDEDDHSSSNGHHKENAIKA